MKTIIKITVTTLTLATTALFASGTHAHSHKGHDHSGHGHSHKKVAVSQTQAEATAKQQLASLIANKKIDRSWSDVTQSKTSKKTFGHKEEWVIVFNNPKIEDVKKQTIYVFLGLSGDITGTNYSGK